MGREFFVGDKMLVVPGDSLARASPLDEQRSIDGLLFKRMDPVASYF